MQEQPIHKSHKTKKQKHHHFATFTNGQLVAIALFFGIVLPSGLTYLVKKTDKKLTYNTGGQATFHKELAKKSAVVAININSAVKDEAKNNPLRPDAGNTFAVVDLSLTNNSANVVHVSPLLQSYVEDENGTRYGMTAVLGHKESVAGPLEAGKTINGSVGYEVPADTKNLTFHYDALSREDSPIDQKITLN